MKFHSFGWGVLHFWWRAELAKVPNLVARVLFSFRLRSSSSFSVVLFGIASIPVSSTQFHLWTSIRASNLEFYPWPYFPPRPWAGTLVLWGLFFIHWWRVSVILRALIPLDPTTRHHPDREPRAAQKLECMGTLEGTQIFASTYRLTCALQKIHARFSSVFIYRTLYFSPSITTVDIHQGNPIWRLGLPWLVNFSASSQEADIWCWGSSTTRYFPQVPWEGRIPKFLDI